MRQGNIAARKLICFVLLVCCLAPMLGCVGLVANLLHAVGAGLMPAAFDGMEAKKVAVICVSNSELFGPTSTSTELSQSVSAMLKKNVKQVEVVPTQKIDDWLDEHDWDMVDFVTIGRDLKADLVLAVDLNSFGLYEGQTLYKGRAEVQLVVYDVASGQPIFSKSPPEIVFPTTAGIFREDVSERDFRRQFVAVLADRIARNFYAFDINDDMARDVKAVSQF